MATYYLDYENGNDANAGDSFAAGHPWKTLTSGATAARIAPGDIIKIAKSPAPTALAGITATWTNLSKTVTLNAAETLEISDCDVDWSVTGVHGTSATASATDWKEGTKKVSIVNAAAPNANEIQAFFATGTIAAATIDDYQGITFWIKNEVAILANQWEINLCSDVDGVTEVDTFPIPAIPSTGSWIPLTIFRNGGGNLGGGGDIKSINVSLGSAATTYTASKYIYIDNINACKTGGLNLQSLISKNSLEQSSMSTTGYANEAWYPIQSIVGTTVLLDNMTSTAANAGKGYSTLGTTPHNVETYKRETIKWAIVANGGETSSSIQDSGTYGNNIQFQGGYDTGTGLQSGETFFDGLNGLNQGINGNNKSFITLNHLGYCRWTRGFYIVGSCNNFTITNIPTCCAHSTNGIELGGYNNYADNIIGLVNSATNLSFYGSNNIINSIYCCNNSSSNPNILYQGSNNLINNVVECLNSYSYGVSFSSYFNNIIKNITTANNPTAGVTVSLGSCYLKNAIINESTEVSGYIDFANSRVFSQNHDNTGYSKIFTDGGNIISQASTLTNGSGTEWKFTTETTTNRQLNYPLNLSIAKVAVTANNLVTVTAWFKKGHATNIGALLICKGGQISGVASDVVATCPSDINENQLSITFTPTENGVVEIEAQAYYIAGHSTVIVDALNITQA